MVIEKMLDNKIKWAKDDALMNSPVNKNPVM